jgi:hypothetical protein
MKQSLTMLLLLPSPLFARADCRTMPCTDGINNIADCPGDECTRSECHQFDQRASVPLDREGLEDIA